MHGKVVCMAGGVDGRGACMMWSVHGKGCVWQGGMHGRETATAADGTHPTRIHSCFQM